MSSAALRPAATDPVAARLRAVAAECAERAEAPVSALADATLDARLDAALAAMSAAAEMVARIVGEADAAGVADRAGCSSTRAWLTGRHGMSPRDAARAVAQASAMRPATEATRLAWARGEICGDKAAVIAHAVHGLPEGADRRRAEAAQADLVARAQTMSLKQLKAEASRLVERIFDPAEAERLRTETLAAQESAAYEQATFRLRKGLDGTARFSGTMPNLTADMLQANLDALASPRRGQSRADGSDGAEHDDCAAGADEQSHPVPYEVRLGRALVEWVERADAKGVSAGDGVNATLVVTVDEQSLRDGVGTAVLGSGDEVSAAEARRLACGADILPMVLGTDSAPLDLGRAARLFDRYQRIALTARDGGCVFPGCDRPPGWAEAHHVRPWSAGGKTDLANGALHCGFHHRLVHRDQGWEVRIAADGIPEVIPPQSIDRRRRPIRHERHRRRRRLRPRPEAC
jgi:hypothetical protein